MALRPFPRRPLYFNSFTEITAFKDPKSIASDITREKTV